MVHLVGNDRRPRMGALNSPNAVGGASGLVILSGLLAIVFFVPNVWRWRLKPNWAWTYALASLLVLCVLRFDQESPFLYFQF